MTILPLIGVLLVALLPRCFVLFYTVPGLLFRYEKLLIFNRLIENEDAFKKLWPTRNSVRLNGRKTLRAPNGARVQLIKHCEKVPSDHYPGGEPVSVPSAPHARGLELGSPREEADPARKPG